MHEESHESRSGSAGGEHGGHGEMGTRGVTRPMHDGHHEGGHGGGMEMGREERMEMLREHHRRTLWVYWALVLLGVWMVAAPLTFDHGVGTVSPSGGREVWLPLEARAAALTWSDLLSGVLLVVFGWRSLTPGRPVSRWICAGVGVWLVFAPIVFWAPTAAAYLNDTFVGMWVIALAVLIPGMPGMLMYMRMGPPTPPGWSYNPSSWPQRAVLIALAFAGLLVSRYLAAFQMGYVEGAWDPFFGEQTRRVLNSELSHSWPVSDAALGTFAYTFEFLMGWMGSQARWRTMPWMVTFFGILVIPLGLVHIALVISQPVVVGAWCTLCLLAAALMLPMIPLQVDEVVAMGQNLRAAHRNGESVWRAFWKGGPAEGSREDERTPEMHTFPERPGPVASASLWGVSFPWTLVASAALGVGLMFVPGALGHTGWAAHLFHLGGALVVVVAVIAMGEPVRLGRWLNVPLGVAVALLPWLLAGGTTAGALIGTAAGLAVAALSVPRGPVTQSYGGWDRFVR